MKKKNFLLQLLLFVFIHFFCQQPVIAEVNLTVGPSDGTNSLRLGRVGMGMVNRKELRVRITSTDGKQYQVFQRLEGPIMNEKGESLDLNAVEMASQSGSNASGTLYLQNISRLSFGEDLLYTSGRNGESDSFLVAYSARPDLMNINGNLFGKLVFTVRAIGESSQDQAYIDLFLDGVSNWKASVEGRAAPDRVRVKDTDIKAGTGNVIKVAFSGNSNQEVKVYQDIEALPRNEKGEELRPDALMFSVEADSEKNIRVQGLTGLRTGRTLLYSGFAVEDRFLIFFLPDAENAALEEAGIYIGKVRYVVESGRGAEEFMMDVEYQVQPVFNMEVSFPSEGVRFPNVLPTNPPADREVVVTVRSNLHVPYQVVQSVGTLMTNEKGQEIGKDAFTMRVELPPGQKGRGKFPEYVPVETGDFAIFSSDSAGSSASFKVIYRLTGYSQMFPGNYAVPVKFSLNQN